ncbi:MAG: Tol-Pal system beta propeller repeat protein TolB, partial [Pseudomonadota bacterium]
MKMRYYLFLLLSFFVITSAQALINLELTQGTRSALPIAIVPFKNVTTLPEDLQVSAVVTHDLTNSGEFSVLTGGGLPETPTSVGEIQLAHWHGLAAQYVVIGSITPMGSDQYRVDMSLVNLYKGQTGGKVTPASVLLTKSYTVQKAQLRRLGHQISDEVYQALLGVPGVFTSKIAYILVQPGKTKTQPDYHLMVSDYDGYNAQSAANSNQPMMSPSWSPDGQQIAFVSFQKTLPAIFIANIRTGALQQVTALAGINGAPAWSPNGKQLAFVSSQTGYAKLYTIDLSTRAITRLTEGYSIDTEPCYMPNGQSLVFTSNRGGNPQIYEYSFAKKSVERLTYVGDYNASANVSPDGKQIAVLHRDKNGFNIAIQNLDTDHFQILTHDNHDESPKFSSNGKLILYATERTLAIVSSDGQIGILLPASEGNVREPTWSR